MINQARGQGLCFHVAPLGLGRSWGLISINMALLPELTEQEFA